MRCYTAALLLARFGAWFVDLLAESITKSDRQKNDAQSGRGVDDREAKRRSPATSTLPFSFGVAVSDHVTGWLPCQPLEGASPLKLPRVPADRLAAAREYTGRVFLVGPPPRLCIVFLARFAPQPARLQS